MIQHPAAGSVVPMAFLFDDGEYLRQIGSPLKKFYGDVGETESVRWYRRRLGNISSRRESLLPPSWRTEQSSGVMWPVQTDRPSASEQAKAAQARFNLS